jgi:hypothetical protein
MAREAQGTAVEEIDQGRISQHQQIDPMVEVVVTIKTTDWWRNNGYGGHG